jgi:hypothetical protein
MNNGSESTLKEAIVAYFKRLSRNPGTHSRYINISHDVGCITDLISVLRTKSKFSMKITIYNRCVMFSWKQKLGFSIKRYLDEFWPTMS